MNMATQTEQQQQLKSIQQLSNFHCLLCKSIAQQPVVSVCGHLFCWYCVHSYKTCPECQRTFNTNNEFIPIYTSSSSSLTTNTSTTKPLMTVPPKPKAINNQKIKNSNVISSQSQLPNFITLSDNVARRTLITGNTFFPPTVIHSFMPTDENIQQFQLIDGKDKKKQIQQLLVIITLLIVACLMAIV